MPFPQTVEVDFTSNGEKNQNMRQALDYAASRWLGKSERRKKFNELYDSYNGIANTKAEESVTKSTGKQSKTKFVYYRIGRTKLKQLHGEFLEINLTPTIRATNREALNRKMTKYRERLGLSLSKPYVEQVRSMGYNIFPGVQIPDYNDKATWNIKNFVLTNEIIIQRIINDKMDNEDLKIKFYENVVDLTITSECFGRVELDSNGIDTYRYIPSKLALYEESIGDIFIQRTPYIGEVRPMYLHEILTSKEFKLKQYQIDELKELVGNNAEDVNNSEFNDSTNPLLNTYTIQWKCLEPVRCKISGNDGSGEPYMSMISNEYYNKHKKQINSDVRKGLCSIEVRYKEVVYEATRIYNSIYTPAKPVRNMIQYRDANNKYSAWYDYTGMLFCTSDGIRVPIQQIISDLERTYDEIRFYINREMKKLKGSVAAFDSALRPIGKTFRDIIHSISEDGIVEYNSSAEGNVSGMEATSGQAGLSQVNLGNNQNLLILIQQAMDIEHVMDRVTGMNDNRSGLTKATMTATANQNNIEASRSMTYDLFFFMEKYIDHVLTALAEKTKLNKAYFGEDQRKFIFSDDEMIYLLSTKDLDFDNYGASITDGKKEYDIMRKMEGLFMQEINAGQLRSKDVARFWMESSFAAALRVLDNAHDELTKINQQAQQDKLKSAEQLQERKMQEAIADREDKQQHDMDLKKLGGEIDQQNILLKGSIDGRNQASEQMADMAQTNNS